jgi:methylenetetrahydrofolate reductase (NADPH)
LKNNGYEPIYQITCRDRNRIALQSEILIAYSFGMNNMLMLSDNMLLLSGDHTQPGDHKKVTAFFIWIGSKAEKS